MCLKQKNLACASSESFIIVDRERAQYKLSITNRIGRRRRLSTTFATFRSCESQVETEKNFHSRFVTLFLLYFICRELCCKSISVKKIARSSKVKLGANWLTWCVQRQPIIIITIKIIERTCNKKKKNLDLLTEIIQSLSDLIRCESEIYMVGDVESWKLHKFKILIGSSSEACYVVRSDSIFWYLFFY